MRSMSAIRSWLTLPMNLSPKFCSGRFKMCRCRHCSGQAANIAMLDGDRCSTGRGLAASRNTVRVEDFVHASGAVDRAHEGERETALTACYISNQIVVAEVAAGHVY